jgi:hypothetical protein
VLIASAAKHEAHRVRDRVHSPNASAADKAECAARRKAEVIIAIRNGETSLDETKDRYGLSDEELATWMRDCDVLGKRGPRSRLQNSPSPQP